MAKRRTIGKKSSSRHSYSEKVKRGTHPFRYSFPVGAAAMAEKARGAYKYSPPADIIAARNEDHGYLEKPKSRRRA